MGFYTLSIVFLFYQFKSENSEIVLESHCSLEKCENNRECIKLISTYCLPTWFCCLLLCCYVSLCNNCYTLQCLTHFVIKSVTLCNT